MVWALQVYGSKTFGNWTETFGRELRPTLKALTGGLAPRIYEGLREVEPMRQWILKVLEEKGSRGGSRNCAFGLFDSRREDVVIPLCSSHFPRKESKHRWAILFYNLADVDSQGDVASGLLRQAANEVAQDLGGDLKSSSGKAPARSVPMRQRDRLAALAKKYKFNLVMPKVGPFGKEPIMKFGAVCCDCEDQHNFCLQTLGHDQVKKVLAQGKLLLSAASGLSIVKLQEGFLPDFSSASMVLAAL
eukprot:CAMPEP_0206573816 /NCGR_PEP_ID=MMETSP0325_2-20121206/29064_1 /ASSEMBLY_ACC=CAM_ASM_000347 /TAXON_ID=2866 /ORGANISM="Crypthecodinium cohnii, Strain Seligo" /LENGTH=245 /DNA_ID=CAMNT_0054078279 /DNA_START=631 /DNA_END=1364 /DNA_ORIENTATION=-